MSLSDKLEKLRNPGPSGSDTRPMKQPEEWRARMDIDTAKGGYVVGIPRSEGEEVDADTVLSEFGLNPNEWTVTSMRRGKWQRYDGDWLESVRVNVVPAIASV